MPKGVQRFSANGLLSVDPAGSHKAAARRTNQSALFSHIVASQLRSDEKRSCLLVVNAADHILLGDEQDQRGGVQNEVLEVGVQNDGMSTRRSACYLHQRFFESAAGSPSSRVGGKEAIDGWSGPSGVAN